MLTDKNSYSLAYTNAEPWTPALVVSLQWVVVAVVVIVHVDDCDDQVGQTEGGYRAT